jgi:hypothetical protein
MKLPKFFEQYERAEERSDDVLPLPDLKGLQISHLRRKDSHHAHAKKLRTTRHIYHPNHSHHTFPLYEISIGLHLMPC